jgi:hypothetical protein
MQFLKLWHVLLYAFICLVIDLAETDFDDFRSDYLGEYEAICETALARESGPWVMKKPRFENLV